MGRQAAMLGDIMGMLAAVLEDIRWAGWQPGLNILDGQAGSHA